MLVPSRRAPSPRSPLSASRRRFVRTSGPSSVIKDRVFEMRGRRPSAVAAVHSSSSIFTFSLPTFTIGSMANTMPGLQSRPLARVDRSSGSAAARAGPCRCRGRRTRAPRVSPGPFRALLHRVPDVRQAVARNHLLDSVVQRPPGTSSRRGPRRRSRPPASVRPSRRGSPPTDDAEVEADDVAVLQHTLGRGCRGRSPR